MDYGRETIRLFEVDQPFCSRTYGAAPCTAVLGVTGTRKCFNTRSTCQDSTHYDGNPVNPPYLFLPGVVGNFATSPDSAAASVTGDIDIRAKLSLIDWTPAATNAVFHKNDDATLQVSYRLDVSSATTGTLTFFWSPDGTITNRRTAQSTVAVGAADGSIKWIRVTLDIDNGAGGCAVIFYISDDGETWTQLGATVTAAGTTSVFDGTAPLVIGQANGNSLPLNGNVYYADVRQGINGTVVAKFEPPYNEAAYNASTFVSETGERWTINTSGGTPAKLVSTALRARFSFPQEQLVPYSPLIPSLRQITTTPLTINLAAMDTSASALGTREVATVDFNDHLHSDSLFDRYRSERLSGDAAVIESGTSAGLFALQFTGATAQYGKVNGSGTLDSTTAFAAEAWIYDPGVSVVHVMNRDSAAGAGGTNRVWIVRKNAGDESQVGNYHCWNSAAVLHQFLPAGSWFKNQLFHLIYTCYVSAGSIFMEVFINGVSVGIDSFPGTAIQTDATTPILFGTASIAAASNPVTIDEFRYYTRRIQAAEAAQHYAGVYTDNSNLVCFIPFEEGTGTTTGDISGIGNHGALVGTPLWVPGLISGSQVRLRSGLSAADGFFSGNVIGLTGGTGGTGGTNRRNIVGYNSARRIVTVDRPWPVNYIPNSDDGTSFNVGDVVNPRTANATDIAAPDGSYSATKWTLVQTAAVNRSFGPAATAMPASPGTTICFSFWVYVPSTNSANPFSAYAFAAGDVPTSSAFNLNALTRNRWTLVEFVHTWGAGATGNVAPQFHSNSAETLGDTMYVWKPAMRYATSRGEYIAAGSTAVLPPDATTTYKIYSDIFDSFARGTMWGKWLGRNLYNNAFRCRVRNGYVGDKISDMSVRNYVIDTTAGPAEGSLRLVAKDLFSFIENQNAVAPLASLGYLQADITSVAGSAVLSPAGIGNLNYPASGNVQIGDEIITFTRVADALTLTVRGALNTVAAAHKQEDAVQLVLSYSAMLAVDIVYDLLLNYTSIEPSELPKADWNIKAAQITGLYTGRISTPTPVIQLLGELAEQAGFTLWPDVSTGKINFIALRTSSPIATVTDDGWIIDKSIKTKYRAEWRKSQVWVYYAQINPTISLETRSNYRSRLVSVDPAAEGPDEYGVPAIKEIFSRWIPQFGRSLATDCGDRQIAIFRDPPLEANFDIVAARDDQLRLAEYFVLETADVQDDVGQVKPVLMATVQLRRDENTISVRAQEVAFVESVTGNDRTIYIENDTQNLNLRTVHDSIYASLPTGSPTPTINFVVLSSVKIGSSSTGLAALRTGSWPVGTLLKLTNGGLIDGHGGAAGAGGTSYGGGALAGNPGAAGGLALLAEVVVSVDNLTGQIWGGGGGGGGGGSVWDPGNQRLGGGGGGGGAGDTIGSGGAGGDATGGGFLLPGSAGASGTLSSGGGPGVGGFISGAYHAGAGGAGGGPGIAGSPGIAPDISGGTPGVTVASSPGTGGAAGKYIQGNALVTWINNGDRRGGVA